ncbi:N-lysine methyltransferase KMT5A-like [Mytilus californianus]|uniref:N-lysine methyltransferase KMT5A-like n=1 Tax=Mytilus californianus TaxID=6549 RepID=UPI002247C872|nr:N-lysine methyltransferase KMT5A-like [Mytilus californianus]
MVTGKGVFAERSFNKGEFLLEYDGDLVSNKEGSKRLEVHSNTLGCYVFFFKYGGKSLSIDATFSKQKGRFVNDGVGADENAVMKKIVVDRSPHLVLFAIRDINSGDEVRYDYGDASRNLPWRKKPFKGEKKNMILKECCVSIRRLEIKDNSHQVACNRETYTDSDSDIENLTRKRRVLKIPSDDEDEENQEFDKSNEVEQVLIQPLEDKEVGSNIEVEEGNVNLIYLT